MKEKVPNITKKQLLPYIRKAWKDIKAYLNIQKVKLGQRYDSKNIYEKFDSRFCDPAKDAEKLFDEYMLCLNRVSKQPSIIRNVVLEIGQMAVNLYLAKRDERLQKRRLQRKQKEENKE